MPNLDDNQKQSVQGQNNWTDNLLVKDKAGKLHPLKGAGVPEVAPDLPVKVDEKKVGATATPLNDNFIPVQYSTTGRSDDTAIFAFHPDDKDQLDNIAKEMPSDDSKKYSIDKIVDKLIEKQQLKFDSENKDKFIDILYQYFRNRRKAPVIREILSTKILSDKKKLAEQLVDNILSIIKGIKAKIEAEGGLVVMQNAMPPLPVLPSQDEEPVVIPPEPKVNIVEDEFADVEGNIEVDEEIKKALFEIEKIEDEPLAVVTPPKLDPESK